MSENQPQIGVGGLMATSISGQALGGALAVVYLAFHHIATPANGIDTKSLEEALTIIFSTGVSFIAMLAHVIIMFLVNKCLTLKS